VGGQAYLYPYCLKKRGERVHRVPHLIAPMGAVNSGQPHVFFCLCLETSKQFGSNADKTSCKFFRYGFEDTAKFFFLQDKHLTTALLHTILF